MIRSARPVVRSCCLRRCHMTAPATGDTDQPTVTDYDKAKPFDQIPGPRGLPLLGTMLQYRKGNIRSSRLQEDCGGSLRQFLC